MRLMANLVAAVDAMEPRLDLSWESMLGAAARVQEAGAGRRQAARRTAGATRVARVPMGMSCPLEPNSGKLWQVPDDKRWSEPQEIGAIGEAYFAQVALRHGLTPTKAHHDVGLDYFCQAIAPRAGTRKSRRVTGATLAFVVRSTTQKDGSVKVTRKDAAVLLGAHLPACLVLVRLRPVPGNAPEGGAIYFRFVDETLASRLRLLLMSDAATTRFHPADLKTEESFDEDVRTAGKPDFVERVRARLATITLQAIDPWAQVETRTGSESRTSYVAFDDYAAPFDLSKPEHRAQFDRALLGASARVETRLHGLSPRLELIEASGWTAAEATVAQFKAPRMVLTAKYDGREASFTAETRLGGGKAVIAHRAGFALSISERRKLGDAFGHALDVHIDEEAHVHLEEHPDLWGFLELCEAKATVHAGEPDGVTVDVSAFKGLYEAGYFARALRLLSASYAWPSGTFYLHDAMSREVLESMSWLMTVCDPSFDYALAVTIGRPASQDPEPVPSWLWVPVCINLARSAAITWLGAKGQLLIFDGVPAGFSIDRVEEVAMEMRPERWTKEPVPELVIHPAWPVASLGGELAVGSKLRMTNTSAAEWGVGMVVANDRESAAHRLRDRRPAARHWRTLGKGGRAEG